MGGDTEFVSQLPGIETTLIPLAEMPPRPPAGTPCVPNTYDLIRSMRGLMRLTDNEDLRADFPAVVRMYHSSAEQTYLATLRSQQRAAYTPQQYWPVIAYVPPQPTGSPIGPHKPLAVGWSVTRVVEPNVVPKGIDPTVPNFSLLVCQPYRARGIDTLLVKQHIDDLQKRFGKRSWASARATNTTSKHILEKAGFVYATTTIEDTGPMQHYAFGG
jgi:GNAT superfamily N-acetyltransferase